MLDKVELAQVIKDALSQQTDGQGQPFPVPVTTQVYADGLISSLQAGIVNHITGTVTGIAPSGGGPISNGAATGGLMVLTPALWIAKTSAGFVPPGPLASLEHKAVLDYMMAFGTVSFNPGDITGIVPSGGGAIANGAGTGGFIVGLTGIGCATFVAANAGFFGPEMAKIYGAIMDYIMENAEVTYAPGTIIGSGPDGGPITAGGVGGTIS